MTHYEIGRGLQENGLPDPDWNMGPIKLYTQMRSVYDEDGMEKIGTEVFWQCRLQWGDTWGDLAFGEGDTPYCALENGLNKARDEGAPEWLFANLMLGALGQGV